MDEECNQAQDETTCDPLEQYLDLCQRIYERMEREGSWPWKNWPEPESDDAPDSTEPDDLVESDENPDDL